MKKIPYRYTNIAKQAFIITIMLQALMRLIIMAEIVIFKVEGYYENTNILLTVLMYAVIFAVLITLFRGHTFCYSLYSDSTLIYRNTLLRRERQLQLSEARLAVMDTFGIKFYAEPDADPKTAKPLFFLPFFRDGIIEAVPVNNFYISLKDRGDMVVIKKFRVLPGYTKKWRFVTIGYSLLAALCLASLSTPLTVIIVLFQNH